MQAPAERKRVFADVQREYTNRYRFAASVAVARLRDVAEHLAQWRAY
jgi:hypothetical protein